MMVALQTSLVEGIIRKIQEVEKNYKEKRCFRLMTHDV